MKVRRVTLELEVPLECTAESVLVLASGNLNHFGIRNQGRVVNDTESTNTYLPELRADVEQEPTDSTKEPKAHVTLDQLQTAFNQFALQVMVLAVEGLADAAIIKHQPMTEHHSLAAVKQLSDYAKELRLEKAQREKARDASKGTLSYDGHGYLFLDEGKGKTIFAEIRGFGAGLPQDANAQRLCDLWNNSCEKQ